MKLRRIITMFLVLIFASVAFTGCVDLKKIGKEIVENTPAGLEEPEGMTTNEALNLVKQKSFAEELDESALNDEYKTFTVGEMANIWDSSYDWAEGTKYQDMYKSRWAFNSTIPHYEKLKSALGENFDSSKNQYVCHCLTSLNMNTGEQEDFSFFVFSVNEDTKDVSAVAHISSDGVVEKTEEEDVIFTYYYFIYSIDEASEYDYERMN